MHGGARSTTATSRARGVAKRRDARAPHDRELVGGLHPAQAVDQRLGADQRGRAERAQELHRRLGPEPGAHRERAEWADAGRHAVEDLPAVVGLADDHQLARGVLAHVELGVHPGHEEHGAAAGPQEAAGDPVVGLRDVAEVGDAALQAGQVLEVGGDGQEGRVGAGGGELLVEPGTAGGVVEHHASARPPAIGLDRRPSRQANEPGADLRPRVAHRPEPSAPLDQQAVPVDEEHAALDVVGAANRELIAWSDVAHPWKATVLSPTAGTGR